MDDTILRWIIGGLSASFFMMFGWVLKRQSDLADDAAASRAKQWEAHNKLRDDHHNLERRMLERMATKTDLNEMESRITQAIKEAKYDRTNLT